MTDQYIPLRQHLPGQTVTHINGRQLPTPMMVSDSKASDLSFESVLNRNQQSQNQINSMPQSYMAYKNGQNQNTQTVRPTPQEVFRPAGIPAMPAQTESNQVSNNTNQINQPVAQDLPPQAMEIINNASADIPQGEDLYKTMIANAQEYQSMKNNEQNVNPGMQSNPMTPGLYDSINQNANTTAQPKAKVQITPAFSNFNVQELEQQPINADLMQRQQIVQSNENPSNSFHSALSMQPRINQSIASRVQPNHNEQLTSIDQQKQTKLVQNDESITQYQNSVSPSLQDLKKDKNADDENLSHAATKTPNAIDATGLFFKNIASGLTLGFYQPPEEPKPEGFMRVIEPVKSIVWDAPKSLLIDVPVGIAHSFSHKNQADEDKQQILDEQQNNSIAYDTRIRDRHSSKPWMNRHLS